MAIQKPDPLPDANVPIVMGNGICHPDWYRWFRFADKALKETVDFANTPEPPPAEIDFAEQWPVLIPFAANKDYVLIQNNDVERVVNATVSDCDSGTCTATFKINSTALGGTANSVSTTEQVQPHASANVLGVGDDLIVTLSANSSCTEVRLNAKTTRTLVLG